MKRNSAIQFIQIMFISLISFLPSILFAEVYDNIGFKKDVPEEIRKACPMCDEFLDVKWIDERKYIGKLKAEWYKDGKKVDGLYYKELNVLYYLVRLSDPDSSRGLASIFYVIDEQQYHSKEFERLIKETDKFEYALGDFIMYAKKGKKQIKLGWADEMPHTTIYGVSSFTKSFSNFSKTICVLYPNKEYISIAETKIPFMKENLSKEEKKIYDRLIKFANDKCKEITGVATKCYTEDIKYCDAVDVNFDGLDDYIFRFNLLDDLGRIGKGIKYIYFSQGDEYKFQELRGCSSKQIFMPIFYAKVGRRAIYYTLCNLTEIVQGGN